MTASASVPVADPHARSGRSDLGTAERSDRRISVHSDLGTSEPDILCADLVRIFTVPSASRASGSGPGIEVQALQGLNLVVDRGELVAVVGASGSGKSTLLAILSSLDVPTAGVARVAGRDLLSMSRRERVAFRRESVGFVWQQTSRNLLPYLTAAENIAAALAIAGTVRGGRARAERAAGLLDLLEVSYCADRRPNEMSGGEQQRVAIAVGIANEPRVLLADEPTGELDDATSAHVLEAMRAVNRELGVTTLIVTHDPGVSDHVARTVQIRDGRTSTEVLRSTRLDEHGAEEHVAEEYAVLDRVGRLQLPDDFVQALDLRERVRLALEADHVRVSPGATTPSPAPAPVAQPAGVAEHAPVAGPALVPDLAALPDPILHPNRVAEPVEASPAAPARLPDLAALPDPILHPNQVAEPVEASPPDPAAPTLVDRPQPGETPDTEENA